MTATADYRNSVIEERSRSASSQQRQQRPVVQYQDAIEAMHARNAKTKEIIEHNANRSQKVRKNVQDDYLKIGQEYIPKKDLPQPVESELPAQIKARSSRSRSKGDASSNQKTKGPRRKMRASKMKRHFDVPANNDKI